MARQLLLLRHAKSDWKTSAATDFDRPLSNRGAKDAPRMGRWLEQHDLKPQLVISSPATRARQTARAVCPLLSVPEETVHWDPRVYEATTGILLSILADSVPVAERVLLVGHNPGLENLLRYLCGPEAHTEGGSKLLPTCGLAVIETECDWAELARGCGHLTRLVRVRELHIAPSSDRGDD